MPAQAFKKGVLIDVFPPFQPMRVKYKDVFDMKAFYEALHEWLLENKWEDKEDHLDHWENFYGERISQGGAREIWIQWRPWKSPKEVGDSKLAYYMDIDFHCIALTTTEIVRNGQKMKMNKGEVELKIRAYIEKRYVSEWENHWFLKHFIDLFTKRIYSDTLEHRQKELYQQSYELQNFVKQWFKLKRYLPYEEAGNFFTSVAYPSHLKE
jgi:hypothetical protein